MKKAMIFYGGWDGHQPYEVAKVFESILLDEKYSVDLFDNLEVLADADKLKEYDLIIPVWTMGQVNPQYTKNVASAIESGVGLAGCHGGMCDAFRNDTEWQFLTGAQWVAHPGGNDVEYRVNFKKSSSNPIIEGLDDFNVKSEQYYIHIDPAVEVLATTHFPVADGAYTANGCVEVPVVFTKKWGKGKVFYSSLGHHADIISDIPQSKEVMRRGFLWATR